MDSCCFHCAAELRDFYITKMAALRDALGEPQLHLFGNDSAACADDADQEPLTFASLANDAAGIVGPGPGDRNGGPSAPAVAVSLVDLQSMMPSPDPGTPEDWQALHDVMSKLQATINRKMPSKAKLEAARQSAMTFVAGIDHAAPGGAAPCDCAPARRTFPEFQWSNSHWRG